MKTNVRNNEIENKSEKMVIVDCSENMIDVDRSEKICILLWRHVDYPINFTPPRSIGCAAFTISRPTPGDPPTTVGRWTPRSGDRAWRRSPLLVAGKEADRKLNWKMEMDYLVGFAICPISGLNFFHICLKKPGKSLFHFLKIVVQFRQYTIHTATNFAEEMNSFSNSFLEWQKENSNEQNYGENLRPERCRSP